MTARLRQGSALLQRESWLAVMSSMTTESMTHFMAERLHHPMKLFKESMVTVMQLQPEQIHALLKIRREVQQELAAISRERSEIAAMLSKVCFYFHPRLSADNCSSKHLTP